MELKAYAIFDKVQNSFHTPIFQHNDGALLRTLQQAANDKDSFLYNNPQDYNVYQVGSWDDCGSLRIGQSDGHPENRKVIEIVELVDPEKRHTPDELQQLRQDFKETRAILDSLKSLIVGKKQAT